MSRGTCSQRVTRRRRRGATIRYGGTITREEETETGKRCTTTILVGHAACVVDSNDVVLVKFSLGSFLFVIHAIRMDLMPLTYTLIFVDDEEKERRTSQSSSLADSMDFILSRPRRHQLHTRPKPHPFGKSSFRNWNRKGSFITY